MPTARMLPQGSLSLHWSRAQPYFRGSIVANPFDWFEALYKYTDINDRLYSPNSSFSGGQSLKDKAFDAKFRLFKETEYIPEVALGFRDLGGTNRFASEFLVATKKIQNFDFTLGLGWGIIAGSNKISNPAKYVSDSFETRGNSGERGQGGKFSPDAWFSGKEMSIFGGFEYYPKYFTKLRLKFEYDTTDYKREGERPINMDSRLNFGLVYKQSQTINLHAGFVRGNTIQLGFTLSGTFSDRDPYKIKKKFTSDLDDSKAREYKKLNSIDERSFYLSTLENLRQNEIYLQAFEVNESSAHIIYSQSKHQSNIRAAGRAVRILDKISPDKISEFKLSSLNGPTVMHSISIPRKEFVRNIEDNNYKVIKQVSEIDYEDIDLKDFKYVPKAIFPVIDYGFTPALRSHIGGPDGFYFGEAYLKGDSTLTFNRNFSINTEISIGIADNFDELKLPSDSVLPHVRTDIVKYLKGGRGFSITRLQADYISRLSKNIYSRLSVGLFEEMFGGVSGEILYRPFTSPFAIGAELSNVTQRDFNQMFDFQEYTVLTGHINAYYKHSPSGVLMTLRGGRYLAKDSGVTLDFSRRFKSGMYVGAFFTLTDISAQEFGEGSFDKGFYFSIPIEVFFDDYAPGRSYFGLKPLTRDGGANLVSGMGLYGVTDYSNYDNLNSEWDSIYD